MYMIVQVHNVLLLSFTETLSFRSLSLSISINISLFLFLIEYTRSVLIWLEKRKNTTRLMYFTTSLFTKRVNIGINIRHSLNLFYSDAKDR